MNIPGPADNSINTGQFIAILETAHTVHDPETTAAAAPSGYSAGSLAASRGAVRADSGTR